MMSNNPLQSDGELQGMLKELHTIADGKHFQRWRTSFLDKFESMLESDGIEKARAADTEVLRKMPSLDRTINNVRSCARTGAISVDKPMGVKGQTAVNKLKEGCVDMEKCLQELVPGSSAEALECGYNKFQLGAVLVKDGFKIYVYIVRQEGILKELKTSILEKVNVDRQIIDAINYYLRQIRSLCDVMADLELFDVMVKTREFAGDKLFVSRTRSIKDKQRPKSDRVPISPSTVVDLLSSMDVAPVDDDDIAVLRCLTPPPSSANMQAPKKPQTDSVGDKEPEATPPPQTEASKSRPAALVKEDSFAERQRRVLSEQEKRRQMEQSGSAEQIKLASEVAEAQEDSARKAILAKRAKKAGKKKANKPTENYISEEQPKQMAKAKLAAVAEKPNPTAAANAREEADKQNADAAKAKAKEVAEKQKAAAAKAKAEAVRQKAAADVTKAKNEADKQKAAAKAKDEADKQKAAAEEQQKKKAAAASKAKDEADKQKAAAEEQQKKKAAAASKAKEEADKQKAVAVAKAKQEAGEKQLAAAAAKAKKENEKPKPPAQAKKEQPKQKAAPKPKPATKAQEERSKSNPAPKPENEDEAPPKAAAKSKPEEKDDGAGGGDDDFIVFYDPKTKAMGKFDRQRCIELGLITASIEAGKEVIKEDFDDEAKMPLMRMIAKSMKKLLCK